MCYVPFVTRSRLINGPEMGVSRLTNGPASVVTQMGRARLCTWPICVFPWWRSGSQTGPAGRHTMRIRKCEEVGGPRERKSKRYDRTQTGQHEAAARTQPASPTHKRAVRIAPKSPETNGTPNGEGGGETQTGRSHLSQTQTGPRYKRGVTHVHVESHTVQ